MDKDQIQKVFQQKNSNVKSDHAKVGLGLYETKYDFL